MKEVGEPLSRSRQVTAGTKKRNRVSRAASSPVWPIPKWEAHTREESVSNLGTVIACSYSPESWVSQFLR